MYVNIVIICTIILIVALLFLNIEIDYSSFKKNLGYKLSTIINTYINKQETNYRRAMIKNEMHPLLYKYNILMSRLKMEIFFLKDFTLFQFKWIVYIFSFLISIFINISIFKNIILAPFLYILCLVVFICLLFSLTIKYRLQRIIDCINTENILAASIQSTFLADVELNLDSIPISLRPAYSKYISNKKILNYSEKDAIAELDLDTGKFSSDFLSNVLIYETDQVEGFENTFKDMVELNNIKKLARNTMNDLIKKISSDFTLAIIISYGSFILELVVSKYILNFYFNTTVGQILLLLDMCLGAGVFLAINVLKSQEL